MPDSWSRIMRHRVLLEPVDCLLLLHPGRPKNDVVREYMRDNFHGLCMYYATSWRFLIVYTRLVLSSGSIYSGPSVLRLLNDFMIVSSDCETLWALPTDDRVYPMMTYEPCDVAVNTVNTFSMVCICI